MSFMKLLNDTFLPSRNTGGSWRSRAGDSGVVAVVVAVVVVVAAAAPEAPAGKTVKYSASGTGASGELEEEAKK
jgi:hypothetical protein